MSFDFGKVTIGLCPICNADQFPEGYGAPDRVSPAHFSVCFGRDAISLRAYLNDEELDNCEECMCGDDGWVVCLPGERESTIGIMCGCRELKYVVKRGRVRVESIEDVRR